jgi:hypothetical protein
MDPLLRMEWRGPIRAARDHYRICGEVLGVDARFVGATTAALRHLLVGSLGLIFG